MSKEFDQNSNRPTMRFCLGAADSSCIIGEISENSVRISIATKRASRGTVQVLRTEELGSIAHAEAAAKRTNDMSTQHDRTALRPGDIYDPTQCISVEYREGGATTCGGTLKSVLNGRNFRKRAVLGNFFQQPCWNVSTTFQEDVKGPNHRTVES